MRCFKCGATLDDVTSDFAVADDGTFVVVCKAGC